MSLEIDKNLNKNIKANDECYVSRNGKIVSTRQASLPCVL